MDQKSSKKKIFEYYLLWRWCKQCDKIAMAAVYRSHFRSLPCLLEKEREEGLWKKSAPRCNQKPKYIKKNWQKDACWRRKGKKAFAKRERQRALALEPWTCDPSILKPNAASQQAGTRT
ncbi:hypothetical protein Golax_022878, partial [Gossypium laxum]|nr:hypothetical protein [Gossypium laxum]